MFLPRRSPSHQLFDITDKRLDKLIQYVESLEERIESLEKRIENLQGKQQKSVMLNGRSKNVFPETSHSEEFLHLRDLQITDQFFERRKE